jgi:hypothetical protein
MRYFIALAACSALLLAGCATSPKKFYEDPSKPDDTSLCRAAMDAGADAKFRHDVADELVRRGMTAESCQAKVNTQDAVIVGAAIIGLGTAAVIACSDGRSCGGGGGYYDDDVDCYGGQGDGPRWQYGPKWVGTYDPYNLDRDDDGMGCEAGQDY